MALNFPSIDSAIATLEGFGKPGAIPTVDNNPGDLVYNSVTQGWGATGADSSGFAIFPDVATGTAAEDQNVSYYASHGATIQSLIQAWVPPNAPGNSPVQTQNYANQVAAATNSSVNTPVSSLAASTGTSSNNLLSGALGSALQGVIPGAGIASQGASAGSAALSGAAAIASPFAWLANPARLTTFVVGLIVIIGGVVLLKPAASFNVVKGVAKGALV